MSKKFDVSLLVQFENDLPIVVQNLDGDEVRVVDYKAVHAVLGVGTRHDDWFKRQVDKFGFVEGKDFLTIERDPSNTANWTAIQAAGGKTRVTWLMTTDMAKEVCMVSATPIGKQVREYFILAEKVAREFALDELRAAVTKQTILADNQKRLSLANETVTKALSLKQGFKTIDEAEAAFVSRESANSFETDRNLANSAARVFWEINDKALRLIKQGKAKDAQNELEHAQGIYGEFDDFTLEDYPWAKHHREKINGI